MLHNGSASAFQADGASSILVIRSWRMVVPVTLRCRSHIITCSALPLCLSLTRTYLKLDTRLLNSGVEYPPCKRIVAGSNPAGGSLTVPDRLKAGQGPLKPLIVVRIHVWERLCGATDSANGFYPLGCRFESCQGRLLRFFR